MSDFKLLNYAGSNGKPRPGILTGGNTVVDLQEALPGKPWTGSTLGVLGAWEEALPALQTLAGQSDKGRRLAEVRLMAPLIYPPAIYCAGANYNAHAKEMSADGKGGVDKANAQPYFFLKSGPHCIIGPGERI